MFYICIRCQKKYEVEDPRPDQRFACPVCHCALLEHHGPRPLNISRRAPFAIRGRRLYVRERDDRIDDVEHTLELAKRRLALWQCFCEDDSGLQIIESWPRAKRLIHRWFIAYKKWERLDTFEKAFREGRLTVRYGKRDLLAVLDPIQAYDKNNVLKKWYLTEDGRVEAHDDEIGFDLTRTPIGNAVGTYWIKKRMNPESYYPVSQKMELGLFDLSATLLNPCKSIAAQTFLNDKKDENEPEPENLWFIFSPLSDPLDQVVFKRLSDLCKGLPEKLQGCQEAIEFHDCVRGIRARMTRIKFASEHDMGTNFRVSPSSTLKSPKLRYGPGDKAFKLYESPEKAFEGTAKNALNFRTILKKGGEVNEIVVAYREHAGLFPIFARLDKNAGCFRVFEFTSDAGDYQFTNALVLNRGVLVFGSQSGGAPPTCLDFTGMRENMLLPPLSKRGKTSKVLLGQPCSLQLAEARLLEINWQRTLEFESRGTKSKKEKSQTKKKGKEVISKSPSSPSSSKIEEISPSPSSVVKREKLTENGHYYTEEEMEILMRVAMEGFGRDDVVVLPGISQGEFSCLSPAYNAFPKGATIVLQPLHVGGNHWALLFIRLNPGGAPTVLYVDPLHPGEEGMPDLSPLRRAFPQLTSVSVSNIRYQNDGLIQHSCGAWIVQLACMLVAYDALPWPEKAPREFANKLREAHEQILHERGL